MPVREFRRKGPPGQPGAEPFKPQITPVWTPLIPLGRGGMNVRQSAIELAPDQATLIQNAKITTDGIRRAWGYSTLGGTVISDTDKVIRALVQFRTLDLVTEIISITNDYAYTWNTSDSWVRIALASGTAMTGDDTLVSAAMVQDALIIAKNGESALITYTGTTGDGGLTEISGSPAARFVVGYADRAVVAHTTANPQLVQWSISGDHTNWSGTGTGSSSLVEDPSQAMDDITGLTVQGDDLLVYRRNSIWVGNRTGAASPAIRFSSRVQGVGCIAGRTLAYTDAGDIFLGSNDVYVYHSGDRAPIRVGTPIQNELFPGGGFFGSTTGIDRTNTDLIHGTYVRETQEYFLFTPTAPANAYVFDVRRYLEDGALVWSRRLFNLTSSGGTDAINSSVDGRIANFSDPDAATNLVLGRSDGERFASDSTDGIDGITGSAGNVVNLIIESPEFILPDRWVQVVGIGLRYTAGTASDVTIDFSVDGGATYGTAFTETLPVTTGVGDITFRTGTAVGRSVQFRLQNTSTGATDTDAPIFHSYRLGLLPRGQFIGRYR